MGEEVLAIDAADDCWPKMGLVSQTQGLQGRTTSWNASRDGQRRQVAWMPTYHITRMTLEPWPGTRGEVCAVQEREGRQGQAQEIKGWERQRAQESQE